MLENNRILPIVQFMDSMDATHARMSRFVPDCLYSAHVKGATESSIVNLCDISGGLVITLLIFYHVTTHNEISLLSFFF